MVPLKSRSCPGHASPGKHPSVWGLSRSQGSTGSCPHQTPATQEGLLSKDQAQGSGGRSIAVAAAVSNLFYETTFSAQLQRHQTFPFMIPPALLNAVILHHTGHCLHLANAFSEAHVEKQWTHGRSLKEAACRWLPGTVYTDSAVCMEGEEEDPQEPKTEKRDDGAEGTVEAPLNDMMESVDLKVDFPCGFSQRPERPRHEKNEKIYIRENGLKWYLYWPFSLAKTTSQHVKSMRYVDHVFGVFVVMLQDIFDHHLDHIHCWFVPQDGSVSMRCLSWKIMHASATCLVIVHHNFDHLSPEVLASLPIQSVEQWWPSGVQLCCQNTVYRYLRRGLGPLLTQSRISG